MNDAPRYVRVADIVSADMDGERVMLNVEQGAYFGLGGVGGTVWDFLDQPRGQHEIVDLVVAEFDVDAATCHSDIDRFLGDLMRQGLVRTV